MPFGRRGRDLTATCFALFMSGVAVPIQAAEPPNVRVENIRRVFHNGEHNAFTDLIRWRGMLWLAFRSCPDGHGISPNASIIILSSTDGKSWEQVHRFAVPKRDTRDPHFLAFKGKLFVYTGTWFAGEAPVEKGKSDFNQHLGHAVWTDNGERWEGPRHLEGTYGHYIWRAATYGDKAYLCGRRAHTGRQQSALLESDDGLVWKFRSLFQDTRGNETAFIFSPDGEITAVARKTSTASDLARSRPPYDHWDRQEIPEFVGGPLLVRWDKQLLVGGRRMTPTGPQTTFSWLIDGKLSPFAQLPSGGDNSYPGFVELEPGRALISWYSTHETGADGNPITAIYLAELVRAK